MKGPRRAESVVGSSLAATRAALAVSAAAMAGLAVLSATVSMALARKVVRPRQPLTDIEIRAVDTAAQTITLSRTADTILPGRYGLYTTGTASYVKLGSVLSSDDRSVTRKLLTHVGPDSRLSSRAGFSGWYFDAPDQLHLGFERIDIDAPVGRCPAWLFPAAPDADVDDAATWVIHVHGRGTTRAECLRAVPVFHAAGLTSLVVSYRNDGEAASTHGGTYALGMTEWRDIDAAVSEALRRGAERIVVMGWSMGGAIALQLALNSAHRESIAGLILESPVIDWRLVLGFHAQQLRVPSPLSDLALSALGKPWARGMTGAETPILFDRLDLVTRAGELAHPILLLHSDDDGFVPSDGSRALAAARPDLVELVTFEVARHTKLWNYDPARWAGSITGWLRRHALSGAAGGGDDAV
ncbi:alpha/beta hydrolase family protein [Microbacterium sp.]|uniref:alpha/beta hydrolase family protein n=1 Tax=Microbacterium sp. TaxID=51671 RepID=UPI003A85BA9D